MVDMKEVDQEHTEQIVESSAAPEAEEDEGMAKLVADGILEETNVEPISKKRGRPRGKQNG
jgi:hypothetical protein